VLLDFWTFACVNCLHVIEELRPLEQRFAGLLVTIGVHSPKFEHEGDPQAVRDAVERYRVRHPVLDDPLLLSWDAYAAKAWPTLVLIDPQGYVVAQVAGEGHVPELAELIERLSAQSPDLQQAEAAEVGPEAAGVTARAADDVRVGDDATAGGDATAGDDVTLRFPGGLLRLPPGRRPGGGLLVSDTAHQQLVIVSDDLGTEKARIGSGERGLVTGGPQIARFADPLGAVLLPGDVAAQAGYDVVVADSGNNALRGLRLADLSVQTLATGISTPWDVAWFDRQVVVAVTGTHQLWSFDPVTGSVRVLAGTGREGLVDGPAARSWFAQPSGLAVGEGGRVLWVADAETSALRELWFADDGSLQVRTVVGQGLFEFGAQDGDGDVARLQHPLAVEVLPDGSVAIADTYNGSIRRYDPAVDRTSTLVRGLAEPAALVVGTAPELGSAGEPVLIVAESAGQRLTRVPIPAGALAEGAGPRREGPIRRPVTDLAPGALELTVRFGPPPGQKLDTACGDPTRLTVTATPADLVLQGAGPGLGLNRSVVLADRVSGGRVEGALLVEARASACDLAEGLGSACYLYRRQWEIPIRLVPGSPATVSLELPGERPGA
jgi:thiol-disulfide isomerase/thioredoxin